MVLVQTFGFGLLTREILARRAANNAPLLRNHLTITRGLKHPHSKSKPQCQKVDPFSAEEIRARLGGSGTRHSYRLLSTQLNSSEKELSEGETWYVFYILFYHCLGILCTDLKE